LAAADATFKEVLEMLTRKWLHVFGAVLILGVLATSSTDAVSSAKRTTYFSFSKPVRLPGVSLPAGTYIFEIADPSASFEIVRVSSRDRRHVYLSAFTRLVHRPAKEKLDHAIVLGERSADTPPPIQVWYPQDERLGRQFLY
jgi:hypothetical protein